MADERDRGIATRAELDRIIADEKNDPPVPQLNHPKPSWMDDPEDPWRKHRRMRDRRKLYLIRRLHNASVEMEQEFDQNS